MDAHLPPETWRSEAFAEDLGDDQVAPAPARASQREPLRGVLLGVLPLALAAAAVGAVAVLWPTA